MLVLIASRVCTDDQCRENERLEICTPKITAVQPSKAFFNAGEKSPIVKALINHIYALALASGGEFAVKFAPADEFKAPGEGDTLMHRIERVAEGASRLGAGTTLFLTDPKRPYNVELYTIDEV
jgi:hypothetical protein